MLRLLAKVETEISAVLRLIGVIVGVSTAFAIGYLGTHKVFY